MSRSHLKKLPSSRLGDAQIGDPEQLLGVAAARFNVAAASIQSLWDSYTSTIPTISNLYAPDRNYRSTSRCVGIVMDLLQIFFDESGLGDSGFWIDPTPIPAESNVGAIPRVFVIGGIVLALLPVIIAIIVLADSSLALSLERPNDHVPLLGIALLQSDATR